MEKKCCNIDVIEIDNGFRIEIKGENVKEHCRKVMSDCCSEGGLQKCFQSLCGTGTRDTKCC